jgi:hypothetical protein
MIINDPIHHFSRLFDRSDEQLTSGDPLLDVWSLKLREYQLSVITVLDKTLARLSSVILKFKGLQFEMFPNSHVFSSIVHRFVMHITAFPEAGLFAPQTLFLASGLQT